MGGAVLAEGGENEGNVDVLVVGFEGGRGGARFAGEVDEGGLRHFILVLVLGCYLGVFGFGTTI